MDELVVAVMAADREAAALHARSTRILAELSRRSGEVGAVHVVYDARAQRRASPLSAGDREAAVREELGARLVVAELAVARRMSEASARAQLDEASRLAELPSVLAALDAGELSPAHARALADGVSEVPEALRGRFEELVMPTAVSGTPAQTRRRARAVRERLHPQSIDVRAARRRLERRFVFEPDRDGMAWLHLHLPCVDARAAFERVDAAARSLVSRTDETRGVAQLRADVAAELLLFGDVHDGSAADATDADAPATGSTDRRHRGRGRYADFRPTVRVTVPVLSLLGRSDEPADLEGYGPIPLGVAEDLAADAPSFMRILTHPESGTVLSVGRSSYAVPADLRRFVQLRDLRCRFPGCERAAAQCDIDHTLSWEHGGQTSHHNLACLCRAHHRLKHQTSWHVARPPGDPDRLSWRSPFGRTTTDRPDPPF